MSNIDKPFYDLSSVWTKRKIHEQLSTKKIKASDISDKDAQWWVEQEDYYRFEAISFGEDYYARNIGTINMKLIERSLKKAKTKSPK